MPVYKGTVMFKRWGLGLLLLLSLCSSVRAERSSRGDAAARQKAGEQALAAHDLPRALAELERAYTHAPSTDLLYHLGLVAQEQGRVLPAVDLLRRYLEEVGPSTPPERRAAIESLLARPRGPANEVTVAGERGALLSVDDRLCGALPLALPLLLAPGPHRLRLAKGAALAETQVSLPPGRAAEVRFTLSPAVAFLKLTHVVLLALSCPKTPPHLPQRIHQAVAMALAKDHAILARPPPGPERARKPQPCPDALLCQEQSARAADAQFVLFLHVDAARPGPAPKFHVSATLHDVATGTPAATAKDLCTECDEQELTRRLTLTISRLLLDATSSGRGTLKVSGAEASGAVVRVDGRALGTLPFEREALAGHHRIRVERPGYYPAEEEITVEEGQTALLPVRLRKLPPPPRRPLRWGAWAVGAVGLVTVVTGAVLWGLDGQLSHSCADRDPSICSEVWDGMAAGLPVLLPGLVALGAAGLLFGLDARQAPRAPEPRVAGLQIHF